MVHCGTLRTSDVGTPSGKACDSPVYILKDWRLSPKPEWVKKKISAGRNIYFSDIQAYQQGGGRSSESLIGGWGKTTDLLNFFLLREAIE